MATETDITPREQRAAILAAVDRAVDELRQIRVALERPDTANTDRHGQGGNDA